MITKTQPLKWEEAMDLLDNIIDPKSRLLFALGFYTGFRVGDIRKLRWNKILKAERISLKEGKTGKQKTVKIHPKLAEIIADSHGSIKPKFDYLLIFSGKDSKTVMSWEALNKRVKKVLKDYEVETVKPSSRLLRKTFARRFFDVQREKGLQAEALIYLGEMFNHSSIKQTRQYIGLTFEMEEKMMMEI